MSSSFQPNQANPSAKKKRVELPGQRLKASERVKLTLHINSKKSQFLLSSRESITRECCELLGRNIHWPQIRPIAVSLGAYRPVVRETKTGIRGKLVTPKFRCLARAVANLHEDLSALCLSLGVKLPSDLSPGIIALSKNAAFKGEERHE
jgi:DNA primase catalytic subunit